MELFVLCTGNSLISQLWILLFLVVYSKLMDFNRGEGRRPIRQKISLAEVRSIREERELNEERS